MIAANMPPRSEAGKHSPGWESCAAPQDLRLRLLQGHFNSLPTNFSSICSLQISRTTANPFLPFFYRREQSSLLHSRPKSTVGTPAYIAPEVLSRREYDGKVSFVICSPACFYFRPQFCGPRQDACTDLLHVEHVHYYRLRHVFWTFICIEY